mgnify:CR=1 FL=1
MIGLPRVLVVDDSPVLRKLLVDAISRHGDEVVGEAATSEEALRLFRKHKPDIVIKDLFMPDDDGVSTIKKMVAIHKKSKIIVCSTFEQKAMIISALRAGAHDFIIKPIKERQVWRVIENVLACINEKKK